MMKNTILLLDKERYLGGGGDRNFRFGIEDRRVFENP